ncbi:SSI family serine proteinase inhibitor [Streptomyces orinoci]|uniref:SSI family serine proteinase inhibitor n=1 Tax=Streptomyces orinoci TaxID=67339 RepID=A0ABV3JRE3_STRON|nr:SSI family serine proteinase inhibitor [Streptomyces orinoci]
MSVRCTVAAAAAATVLLAPAPPSAAAEQERGSLFLTVSGAGNTWIRGLRLVCPSPGRSHHPHAAEACAGLSAAHGRLDALTGDRQLCTKEYDPVTATADGDWQGMVVHWRKDYPNACLLDAATGTVFRF